MKKCAEGCGRLGVGLRCPMCQKRTCRERHCVDEHTIRHIMSFGLTREEALEAMADPVFSEAEDRTLDRLWERVQERRRGQAN